ncbi:MAG: hypothetical protein FWG88_05105 [Oscillospiraceae bacterium]|nr:hypothetical protein [Oscillospiraceae bacterium]
MAIGETKNEEIKRWLNRGRAAMREVEALKTAKLAAEVRAASGSATGKLTSKRSAKGRGDGALVQVLEYGRELDARIAELDSILVEIARAIYAVEDGTLRLLLINRYILFKKWEQVAIDMGYSYTNVTFRLHPKALEAVEELRLAGKIRILGSFE